MLFRSAKREDIGWFVEATAEGLGCEVVSVSLPVNVLWRGPRASKTKVCDLETTLEVDEDVGRLEVQVDVPRVVDECKTLRYC